MGTSASSAAGGNHDGGHPLAGRLAPVTGPHSRRKNGSGNDDDGRPTATTKLTPASTESARLKGPPGGGVSAIFSHSSSNAGCSLSSNPIGHQKREKDGHSDGYTSCVHVNGGDSNSFQAAVSSLRGGESDGGNATAATAAVAGPPTSLLVPAQKRQFDNSESNKVNHKMTANTNDSNWERVVVVSPAPSPPSSSSTASLSSHRTPPPAVRQLPSSALLTSTPLPQQPQPLPGIVSPSMKNAVHEESLEGEHVDVTPFAVSEASKPSLWVLSPALSPVQVEALTGIAPSLPLPTTTTTTTTTTTRANLQTGRPMKNGTLAEEGPTSSGSHGGGGGGGGGGYQQMPLVLPASQLRESGGRTAAFGRRRSRQREKAVAMAGAEDDKANQAKTDGSKKDVKPQQQVLSRARTVEDQLANTHEAPRAGVRESNARNVRHSSRHTHSNRSNNNNDNSSTAFDPRSAMMQDMMNLYAPHVTQPLRHTSTTTRRQHPVASEHEHREMREAERNQKDADSRSGSAAMAAPHGPGARPSLFVNSALPPSAFSSQTPATPPLSQQHRPSTKQSNFLLVAQTAPTRTRLASMKGTEGQPSDNDETSGELDDLDLFDDFVDARTIPSDAKAMLAVHPFFINCAGVGVTNASETNTNGGHNNHKSEHRESFPFLSSVGCIPTDTGAARKSLSTPIHRSSSPSTIASCGSLSNAGGGGENSVLQQASAPATGVNYLLNDVLPTANTSTTDLLEDTTGSDSDFSSGIGGDRVPRKNRSKNTTSPLTKNTPSRSVSVAERRLDEAMRSTTQSNVHFSNNKVYSDTSSVSAMSAGAVTFLALAGSEESRYQRALGNLDSAAADAARGYERVAQFTRDVTALMRAWNTIASKHFEPFAIEVFTSMLAEHPDYADLFLSSGVKEQARTTLGMVGKAVLAFSRMDEMLDLLTEIGARHCLYGVEERHFIAIRKHFLKIYPKYVTRQEYKVSANAWKMFWRVTIELLMYGKSSPRAQYYLDMRKKRWILELQAFMTALTERQLAEPSEAPRQHMFIVKFYDLAVEREPAVAVYRRVREPIPADRSYEAIGKIAANLDDAETVQQYITELGNRHSTYNLTPAIMAIFRAAFLSACEFYMHEHELWRCVPTMRRTIAEFWELVSQQWSLGWEANRQRNAKKSSECDFPEVCSQDDNEDDFDDDEDSENDDGDEGGDESEGTDNAVGSAPRGLTRFRRSSRRGRLTVAEEGNEQREGSGAAPGRQRSAQSHVSFTTLAGHSLSVVSSGAITSISAATVAAGAATPTGQEGKVNSTARESTYNSNAASDIIHNNINGGAVPHPRTQLKGSAAYAPQTGEPVCILFTDIEASTTLWETNADAMALAVHTHGVLIRALISDYGGYEIKTIGDSFMIATRNPLIGLKIALGIQLEMMRKSIASGFSMSAAVPNPQGGGDASCWRDDSLRVRVGLHYGTEASVVFDSVHRRFDYYGSSVNCAARVEAAACGGQILMTKEAVDALDQMDSFYNDAHPRFLADFANCHQPVGQTMADIAWFNDIGPSKLKGIGQPVHLFSVVHKEVAGRDFANAPAGSHHVRQRPTLPSPSSFSPSPLKSQPRHKK